jgi:hypothetical protein
MASSTFMFPSPIAVPCREQFSFDENCDAKS